MGIFDKKQCSICGKDIGIVVKYKLEDGNLCKDCAAKVSPWYDMDRKRTVEDLRSHLAYREKNRETVKALRPTRVFGEDVKIYLDENARKFVATRVENWQDRNPDVISLDQIRRCELLIGEESDEIMDRDEDGRPRSFDPPRYEYEYQFNVDMDIDGGFFNKLQVELSRFGNRPREKDSEAYRALEQTGKEICALLTGKAPEEVTEKVEQRNDEHPAAAAPAPVQEEAKAPAEAPAEEPVRTAVSEDVFDEAPAEAPAEPELVFDAAPAEAPEAPELVFGGEPDRVTPVFVPGADFNTPWKCSCGYEAIGNYCANCGLARPKKWFCPDCGAENGGLFCIGCGRRRPD